MSIGRVGYKKPPTNQKTKPSSLRDFFCFLHFSSKHLLQPWKMILYKVVI